jgi:hypothetical protein
MSILSHFSLEQSEKDSVDSDMQVVDCCDQFLFLKYFVIIFFNFIFLFYHLQLELFQCLLDFRHHTPERT